jgi:hypothetical protein
VSIRAKSRTPVGHSEMPTGFTIASPIDKSRVFCEVLVAGACNHPNCLVIPFRAKLIRDAA